MENQKDFDLSHFDEPTKRQRLARAVESLLEIAIDTKDWAKVAIASDALCHLRETSRMGRGVGNYWNKDLEEANNLF